MIVRICDKVVNAKGEESIRNIRRVECTELYDRHAAIYNRQVDGRWAEKCSFENVLLYIDPETRKATVAEMWLENMVVR